MDNWTKLLDYVEAAKVEAAKFKLKGNQASGTRFRKCLLEIGKLTKTIRTEVQDAKKDTHR